VNESLAIPQSLDELRTLLRSESSILAVGNQTKKPLASDEQARLVSLREIKGILEYEPSEFTFTAYAGTTISEVNQTLQQRQQYLPFDPMLVDAGATIGGSVGAGLSGPGRFRYGGLRDFLLGVKFLSGDGEVINSGGKVVKNAAGFDMPKLLAGSMGRLGVMVEMTFKVFPMPGSHQTLAVACDSLDSAMQRMSVAAASQWELDAIDYRPASNTLFLRLAGPEKVNQTLVRKMIELWGADVTELPDGDAVWQSVTELNWAETSRPLAVKVPVHRSVVDSVVALASQRSGVDLHFSAAGAVAWLLCESQDDVDELDQVLLAKEVAGLVVRGDYPRPGIGFWPCTNISLAVKQAMDPVSKFPYLFHT
jgi:glycolate oxidase FAD binding subunit